MAGVGGVDPLHVGVDLAQVRPAGGGDGHGAGVRAAPPQGGDVVVPVQALEPRHNDDVPFVQLVFDPLRLHPADAGVAVGGIGDKARLPPGEGLGGIAQALNRHG